MQSTRQTTRVLAVRVWWRIVGGSPYGDEYRTIRYSRPSGDGHQRHVVEHKRALVLVLGEVDSRSRAALWTALPAALRAARTPTKPAVPPAPDAQPDPESSPGLSQEEFHSQFDNQILSYVSRVYHGIAHPLHPDRENVQRWISRCRRQGKLLQRQVARLSVDAVTAEDWYMKYGDESHISREDFSRWLFW